MKKLIIITDLDGTLLDSSTYSFAAAHDALRLIEERDIPFILCSSKTRAEIEYYRLLLHNQDPFISENGGGIFIPVKCKALVARAQERIVNRNGEYFVIPLGADYAKLRKGIGILRRVTGLPIKGFGDMKANEIAVLTGLPLKEASMAKKRDFDEPFLFYGRESDLSKLHFAAKALGFNITRGRFYHLLGKSDKGVAVELVLDFYKREYGHVFSVALGDSANDLPMLEKVDAPIIVQKNDGSYEPKLDIPGVIRADGVGPEGWNKAIIKIVADAVDL